MHIAGDRALPPSIMSRGRLPGISQMR